MFSSIMSSGLVKSEAGEARMNMGDLANLLDNDGNLQNEMMVAAFAATLLATIPVLLGNEFDVNVGLKKKKRSVEYSTLRESRFNPKFGKYVKNN